MDPEKMTARELADAGESGAVEFNALKGAAKRHLGDDMPNRKVDIIKALRALDGSADSWDDAATAGGDQEIEKPAPRRQPTDRKPGATIAFPLPDDLPERALAEALLVVKSKSPRGRRRAGYGFTPEETELPWAGLVPAVRDAIVADPQLVCALRLMD